MALTIARTISTLIANGDANAGSHITASATDLGDGALIRGLWVHTTIVSGGWSTAPSNADRVVVSVFPWGTGSALLTNDPVYSREHRVNTNSTYRFSDYFDGPVPRWVTLDLHNATGQDMSANVVTMSAEWIKETT